LPGALQRGFAMGGDEHGVACFIQGIVKQGEVFRHIVHDQDNIRQATVNGRHRAFS
jgi:hypothetical protein